MYFATQGLYPSVRTCSMINCSGVLPNRIHANPKSKGCFPCQQFIAGKVTAFHSSPKLCRPEQFSEFKFKWVFRWKCKFHQIHSNNYIDIDRWTPVFNLFAMQFRNLDKNIKKEIGLSRYAAIIHYIISLTLHNKKTGERIGFYRKTNEAREKSALHPPSIGCMFDADRMLSGGQKSIRNYTCPRSFNWINSANNIPSKGKKPYATARHEKNSACCDPFKIHWIYERERIARIILHAHSDTPKTKGIFNERIIFASMPTMHVVEFIIFQ